MTLADFIILSILFLLVGYSLYKMIKNHKQDTCSGCDSHQPKWIKDYQRKLK